MSPWGLQKNPLHNLFRDELSHEAVLNKFSLDLSLAAIGFGRANSVQRD